MNVYMIKMRNFFLRFLTECVSMLLPMCLVCVPCEKRGGCGGDVISNFRFDFDFFDENAREIDFIVYNFQFTSGTSNYSVISFGFKVMYFILRL